MRVWYVCYGIFHLWSVVTKNKEYYKQMNIASLLSLYAWFNYTQEHHKVIFNSLTTKIFYHISLRTSILRRNSKNLNLLVICNIFFNKFQTIFCLCYKSKLYSVSIDMKKMMQLTKKRKLQSSFWHNASSLLRLHLAVVPNIFLLFLL